MSGVVEGTSLRYITNPHLSCSQPVFTSYEAIHSTSYPTQLHKVILALDLVPPIQLGISCLAMNSSLKQL